MAPTRELAIQIAKDATLLSKHTKLKVGIVYGGEGYDAQRKVLDKGVDILIGTTGRIIDYVRQGVINLSAIQAVVLDEADRMFDLGFIKDIRFLFRRMPDAKDRLNMLFSATLSMKVQELAYDHMNDPVKVEIAPEEKTSKNIKEELFYPSMKDKIPLLLTLIEEDWPDKAIVFANTKHQCENLWGWLEGDGHRVGLLTGDVPQKKRLKILELFTKGDLDILVATDVAAVACIFLMCPMSITSTCLMTVKTMFTVSVVPAVPVPKGFQSALPVKNTPSTCRLSKTISSTRFR